MKKILVFIAAVLAIVSVLFSGCRAPTAEPEIVPAPAQSFELTEKYIKSLAPLCPKIEIKDVDFTILKDVDFINRHHSIFTAPSLKDTFGNTQKDQAYLMRAARDTLFTGFLSVPLDRVPAIAIQWIEEEIESGRYDYQVFNRIYQELLKDPRYEYLKDPSQKEKLLKIMIEGMIKALDDPFTNYLTKDQWILTEKGSIEGRYRGMGIGLEKTDRGEISITSVASGSPAEKAGLKPGDIILAVDEKSVLECSISQFIVHVKTREDPKMNLIVKRKLSNILERVELTMEQIRIRELFTGPGVELPEGRGSTAENLPFYYPLRDKEKKEHPDILYIKIKEFSLQASLDLEYALNNLNLSNFKGIIIDLRGNPGGRVDSIIYCVDYFLPTDAVITTIKEVNEFMGNEVVTTSAIRYNQLTLVPPDLPIVILVDKDSASGAELFPAALRDNGRAVIISKDESTAGKGSVNRHFTLRKGEYGALYVSIGLWYTPSGQMIEKMDLDKDGYYEVGGLKPDILVGLTDEDIMENKRSPAWYDPIIFRAINWIEEQGEKK